MQIFTYPDINAKLIAGFIDDAKSSIDITIFRLSGEKIKEALYNAVRRGVKVRAILRKRSAGWRSKIKDIREEGQGHYQ